MSSDLRLVLTTCGSREMGDQVATALVEKGLAACVNAVDGVRSTYRWQGKIERDDEVLLIIKTAESELTAIETEIKALSNYELPELVAVEITSGATDYLDWVRTSIRENTE